MRAASLWDFDEAGDLFRIVKVMAQARPRD
jgi:hypothetical protein